MKEVLRQSHKSCIYYPVYPRFAGSDAPSTHSLITGKTALNAVWKHFYLCFYEFGLMMKSEENQFTPGVANIVPAGTRSSARPK